MKKEWLFYLVELLLKLAMAFFISNALNLSQGAHLAFAAILYCSIELIALTHPASQLSLRSKLFLAIIFIGCISFSVFIFLKTAVPGLDLYAALIQDKFNYTIGGPSHFTDSLNILATTSMSADEVNTIRVLLKIDQKLAMLWAGSAFLVYALFSQQVSILFSEYSNSHAKRDPNYKANVGAGASVPAQAAIKAHKFTTNQDE